MFAATSIELFELTGVLSRHCFAEYDLKYRFWWVGRERQEGGEEKPVSLKMAPLTKLY